jgi:hypothetical protein
MKQKTPALFRARGFLFAEDGLAVTYFRVRDLMGKHPLA